MDSVVLENLRDTHFTYNQDTCEYEPKKNKSTTTYTRAYVALVEAQALEALAGASPKKMYHKMSMLFHPDKRAFIKDYDALSDVGAFVHLQRIYKNALTAETFNLEDCYYAALKENKPPEKMEGFFSAYMSKWVVSVIEKDHKTVEKDIDEYILLKCLHVRFQKILSAESASELQWTRVFPLDYEHALKAVFKSAHDDILIHSFMPILTDSETFQSMLGRFQVLKTTVSSPAKRALVDSIIFVLEQHLAHQLEVHELRRGILKNIEHALPYFTAGVSLFYGLPALCFLMALTHSFGDSKESLLEGDIVVLFKELLVNLVDEEAAEKESFGRMDAVVKAGVYSVIGLNFMVWNGSLHFLHNAFASSQKMGQLFLNPPPLYWETFMKTCECQHDFIKMLLFDMKCYMQSVDNQIGGWLRTGYKKKQGVQSYYDVLVGIDASVSDPYEAREKVSVLVMQMMNNSLLLGSGKQATRLVENLRLRLGEISPDKVFATLEEGEPLLLMNSSNMS